MRSGSIPMASLPSRRPRPQVQAHEHALGIRQVADDLAHRLGQPADQGGDGQDLVRARELGVGDQVHDLDAVLAGQVLLAEPLQVGEGRHGLRGLTGNIQPQVPVLRRLGVLELRLLDAHARLLILGFGAVAAGASHGRSAATREASARLTPWAVSRNSRTWFEWAIPRDLMTLSTRPRAPFASVSRSSSQVSISDETPTSEDSRSLPPCVRLMNRAVISAILRK